MNTRILYVITKANWGGAQRYVYDLATEAQNAENEVAVAYGEFGLLVKKLEEAKIRTISVPELGRDVHFGKDIGAYRALVSLFKKESPDVVHLNSSKAGFLGALAAHVVGIKKIIFTAHGWAFTEPRNFLSRKIIEKMQKQTAVWSTHVIAVSEFIKSQTKEWGLPDNKIQVIRLGIREQSFVTKEQAREFLMKIDPSLNESKNDLWVGTIAELHKNKGIDIGINGWNKASLSNADWIIIGDGEEKDDLEKLANASKTLHLLGFVPDAAQYLKAFDLFLLPSRTEALGYVILEAGMAGVPVLTSGVGGLREAVGPEYPATGYFKIDDTSSLSEVLKTILKDSGNLKKLGETLEQHVRKTFSFNKMIEQILSLYN